MTNSEKALQAFKDSNFREAANIWINGYCLPDDNATLRYIFSNCQDKADADVYALLGFIYLDHSEVFTNDRQAALMQVVSWSKEGLAVDPQHYLCSRHAGSALYWLEDYAGARKYYERAIAITPAATLQVRLFKMSGSDDYNKLQIDMSGTVAMEYYNAGVEINRITCMVENEYLNELKYQLYERAYTLYEDCLVKGTGHPFNHDGHTFAMCCNNFAIELTAREDYTRTISCLNTGMQFSYFQALLENRFYAYEESGQVAEAFADAMKLFDDFEDGIYSLLYFRLVQTICKYYKQIGDDEELIEWANAALEGFMELEASEQGDPFILRYYSNIMMYKANAEVAAGTYDGGQYEEAQDQTLMNNPTDPTLIINRAMLFNNEGNPEKALECYDQAIHYATQQDNPQSLRVANYNKGHLLLTKFNNAGAALGHFVQIDEIGLADFWSLYWCAHCCYELQENEACVLFTDRAIGLLDTTPGVHDEVISLLHGYKGTSLFDLEDYAGALESYRKSLEYGENQMVRENMNRILAM